LKSEEFLLRSRNCDSHLYILTSIRDKVLIMTHHSFVLLSFQVIPDLNWSLKWNIIFGEIIKVKSAMKNII